MTARRNARNRTSPAAKPPLLEVDLDGLNAFFVDQEGSYETVYRVSALAAMWPGIAPQWLDESVRAARAAELELRLAETEAQLDALRGAP